VPAFFGPALRGLLELVQTLVVQVDHAAIAFQGLAHLVQHLAQ